MTDLAAKHAELKQRMQGENPSVQPGKTVAEKKRIPMNLPMQKLQVPEIPGFHLHWMRGDAQRIQQAKNAGYDFVRPDEVDVTSISLGGDATKNGNSDMGDRVSVVAGGVGDDGQAIRLYLMKQPLEYYMEDLKIVEQRNESVAQALTAQYRQGLIGGRAEGESLEDAEQRYIDKKRTKMPALFRRKKPPQ